MPVIQKTYPCGCIIGIAVVDNRLRCCGILKRCGLCSDIVTQAYLEETRWEVASYETASKYIGFLDRS